MPVPDVTVLLQPEYAAAMFVLAVKGFVELWIPRGGATLSVYVICTHGLCQSQPAYTFLPRYVCLTLLDHLTGRVKCGPLAGK